MCPTARDAREVDGLVVWLVRMRRLALFAQLVLLIVAFATDERPVAGLLLLAAFALLEGLRSALVWGEHSGRSHAIADWLGLTLLLIAWGEPHQPLTVFYLVEAALFAAFTGRREAWVASACAIAGHCAALFVPLLLGTAQHGEPAVHLAAHAATFALGAVAITHFLGGVAEERRAAALTVASALEAQQRAARLAAIGTVAAGVAHELATPLGSIELLAEEAGTDPAALSALRGELSRCRSILDRMLARGAPSEGRTEDAVAQILRFIEAWQRAQPEVQIALSRAPDTEALTVRGAPDGWRAALWTVLDNAKIAGPPLTIAIARTERGLLLSVDDAGPGIADEIAARVGEPFLSRWGTLSQGAGLGLYVARTFARGTGGDLSIAALPGRGSRAVLLLPIERAVTPER